MLDYIRNCYARWQALREIASLRDRDIEDIGLDRATLEDIAHLPEDVPDRMVAMAGVHGLRAEDLRSDWGRYLDLVRTCGHCRVRARCGRTLAATWGPSPEGVRFCPNAQAYAALAAGPKAGARLHA